MTGRRNRHKRYKYPNRFQNRTQNVTASTQTDCNGMGQYRQKRQFSLQNFQSVNRITNLPIVESGWNYAGTIYRRIKTSNNLLNWTFDQAENSFHTVVDTALPAIVLFQGPLSSIDRIVSKGLDMVEQKVPSINLPPEMIYWNTKQYVKDVGKEIVRPVLKRADSVKQIGNTVLASKYTAFAADTLDGALNVADKYVDKYLPADDDQVDEVNNRVDGPAGKAINSINHVNRFSKKLQRRLTKRTIAEMKALKEQSAEAVHVLIYVAELIATDPKLAYQKGKELWVALSKDEPENQARPENLEQLIVLLTRECARRVVHLINFTSSIVSTVPRHVSNSALFFLNKVLQLTDALIKTAHLENVKMFVLEVLTKQSQQLSVVLKRLNLNIVELLEHLSENLQNAESSQRAALRVPQIKVQLRAENKSPKLHSNGSFNENK